MNSNITEREKVISEIFRKSERGAMEYRVNGGKGIDRRSISDALVQMNAMRLVDLLATTHQISSVSSLIDSPTNGIGLGLFGPDPSNPAERLHFWIGDGQCIIKIFLEERP